MDCMVPRERTKPDKRATLNLDMHHDNQQHSHAFVLNTHGPEPVPQGRRGRATQRFTRFEYASELASQHKHRNGANTVQERNTRAKITENKQGK